MLEKGKKEEKGLENIPSYDAEKVEITSGQEMYLNVQTQHKMRGEMLLNHSIMMNVIITVTSGYRRVCIIFSRTLNRCLLKIIQSI